MSCVSSLVSTVDIPHKGRGLVANESLKKGTLIFVEEPIKTLSKWNPTAIDIPTKIVEELAEVSGVKAEDVLTNAFVLTEEKNMNSLAIFKMISLINHSCMPNCTVVNSNDGKVAAVYTLFDVEPDEELCICYRPELMLMPKVRRQTTLQTSHNFECCCSRCQNDDDLDDDVDDSTYQSFDVCCFMFENFIKSHDKSKEGNKLRKLFRSFIYHTRCLWIKHAVIRQLQYVLQTLLRYSKIEFEKKQLTNELEELLWERIQWESTILPSLHDQRLVALKAYNDSYLSYKNLTNWKHKDYILTELNTIYDVYQF